MKKLVLFMFVLSIVCFQKAALGFTIRNIINNSRSNVTLTFCYNKKTEVPIVLEGKKTLKEVNKPFPAYESEENLKSFERIWDWDEETYLPTHLKVVTHDSSVTTYAVEGITSGAPGAWVKYP